MELVIYGTALFIIAFAIISIIEHFLSNRKTWFKIILTFIMVIPFVALFSHYTVFFDPVKELVHSGSYSKKMMCRQTDTYMECFNLKIRSPINHKIVQEHDYASGHYKLNLHQIDGVKLQRWCQLLTDINPDNISGQLYRRRCALQISQFFIQEFHVLNEKKLAKFSHACSERNRRSVEVMLMKGVNQQLRNAGIFILGVPFYSFEQEIVQDGMRN